MSLDEKKVNTIMTDNIKVREVTSKSNIKYKTMLPRTLCHGLVIFTLGFTLSMRGPSFIDILQISGVDVTRGSFYFTASAFGYVIGAFLTGLIYARVKTKDMLIIGPLLVSAAVFSVLPWCSNYVLMLLVHFAVSFFGAMKETTVNTEEVKRWEGNSYTAMQFLSFAYSLGGIIGPLIVEPFLAPKVVVSPSNMSTDNNNNIHFVASSAMATSGFTNISHDQHNTTNSFLTFTTAAYLHEQNYNSSSSSEIYNFNNFSLVGNRSINSHSNQTQPWQTNIYYAYYIAGAVIAFCCIPLCVLHFWTRKSQQEQIVKKSDEVNDKRLPLKMYVILTGLLSLFYFFYTTIDDPYTMYLSIFVVSHLDWSKEDGAIVSSLYWGCSTATKLVMVMVVLVHYVNASLILFCSCLGMVIFMTMFTICAYFRVHFMIWLCTALMALSQSAIFGGGFSWMDTHLLKVDGKVTSCAMICSSLGAMVAPMLLGVMMEEISPMAFPCLLTFQAIVTFAIFIVMLALKPYVTQKFGLPRAESQNVQKVEEKSNLFQHV